MIVYSIFIIIGSLLLVAAVASMKNRMAFLNKGERAVGTVVNLEKRKDDEGEFYYPVFEVRTRQQERMEYKSSGGSSFPLWKVGDTRNFIFIPGKPETLVHLSYWKLFGWSLILMSVSVDLLMIGAGYFLLSGYFNV
ncbi:MAG: DUF3592 domain-containing protein [Chitinophaga sp.]|uniref:DUF3592 domain-containing protein n=1 Tax=Chitinophaga sp. TaxID=1869181 RepID=UPI001AFFB4F0|nr:DUF3592 domain-containing protein [Chitinophaga sp.]MBO9731462.1 DUF3592 domain-containing protein [Chitinophaga sp.]